MGFTIYYYLLSWLPTWLLFLSYICSGVESLLVTPKPVREVAAADKRREKEVASAAGGTKCPNHKLELDNPVQIRNRR